MYAHVILTSVERGMTLSKGLSKLADKALYPQEIPFSGLTRPGGSSSHKMVFLVDKILL